jgi:hypothetical protein
MLTRECKIGKQPAWEIIFGAFTCQSLTAERFSSPRRLLCSQTERGSLPVPVNLPWVYAPEP